MSGVLPYLCVVETPSIVVADDYRCLGGGAQNAAVSSLLATAPRSAAALANRPSGFLADAFSTSTSNGRNSPVGPTVIVGRHAAAIGSAGRDNAATLAEMPRHRNGTKWPPLGQLAIRWRPISVGCLNQGFKSKPTRQLSERVTVERLMITKDYAAQPAKLVRPARRGSQCNAHWNRPVAAHLARTQFAFAPNTPIAFPIPQSRFPLLIAEKVCPPIGHWEKLGQSTRRASR
jgi:hypothetical protein